MKLDRKKMLLISFMLFSLFFGAGNLIFPPFLGQNAGSSTVSLSNPFGARWNPGGQGKTVHNGIDIPGTEGTAILAAADGTVTETGWSSSRSTRGRSSP